MGQAQVRTVTSREFVLTSWLSAPHPRGPDHADRGEPSALIPIAEYAALPRPTRACGAAARAEADAYVSTLNPSHRRRVWTHDAHQQGGVVMLILT